MRCVIRWIPASVVGFCFILCNGYPAAGGVVEYQGDVSLQPSTGVVTEALMIHFVAPVEGASQIELYLNADIKVGALSCPQCIGYREGAVDPRSNARPVIIGLRRSLKGGEGKHIRFTCGGTLTNVSSDTNSFSPTWVELSIDSGWYPYELENRDFRYKLHVKIDTAYKVSGNAGISGGKGNWYFQQNTPTFDIDVVAAPNWKTTVVHTNSLRVRILAVNVPPRAIEKFAKTASATARTYSEWFGNAAAHDLTLILNPREDGSSYSRPGYVSLAYSKDPTQADRLTFNLAHEVAHFWWLGAPATTWENWLNESFAEYSALMYARKSEGDDSFKNLMLQRVERSKGEPAIWGIDRKSPRYAIVIYAKGAVRLQQLEEMLGADKFRSFLAMILRKHIKSTGGLLDELQAESSVEVRQRFERLLKS